MKWVFLTIAVLVLVAGVMALVGAALPLRHHAARDASFSVSPEALYAVIAGPPGWRAGVKRFGVLPPKDGRRQFWEEDSHARRITYEVTEEVPPKRLVVRMTDTKLPFGGIWSYDISPATQGGSMLRISEDGEIYNVIFRFMAHYIFGYSTTIENYIRDLQKKFPQSR
jgi:hypothetical protein